MTTKFEALISQSQPLPKKMSMLSSRLDVHRQNLDGRVERSRTEKKLLSVNLGHNLSVNSLNEDASFRGNGQQQQSEELRGISKRARQLRRDVVKMLCGFSGFK